MLERQPQACFCLLQKFETLEAVAVTNADEGHPGTY